MSPLPTTFWDDIDTPQVEPCKPRIFRALASITGCTNSAFDRGLPVYLVKTSPGSAYMHSMCSSIYATAADTTRQVVGAVVGEVVFWDANEHNGTIFFQGICRDVQLSVVVDVSPNYGDESLALDAPHDYWRNLAWQYALLRAQSPQDM